MQRHPSKHDLINLRQPTRYESSLRGRSATASFVHSLLVTCSCYSGVYLFSLLGCFLCAVCGAEMILLQELKLTLTAVPTKHPPGCIHTQPHKTDTSNIHTKKQFPLQHHLNGHEHQYTGNRDFGSFGAKPSISRPVFRN